jgi:hypothetical protein
MSLQDILWTPWSHKQTLCYQSFMCSFDIEAELIPRVCVGRYSCRRTPRRGARSKIRCHMEGTGAQSPGPSKCRPASRSTWNINTAGTQTDKFPRARVSTFSIGRRRLTVNPPDRAGFGEASTGRLGFSKRDGCPHIRVGRSERESDAHGHSSRRVQETMTVETDQPVVAWRRSLGELLAAATRAGRVWS